MLYLGSILNFFLIFFSKFFFQLFHFFTLLVAPSSSSLLPPRPSFLLVPPSSLFLFLPRPALSQSLRIHKRPFFIDFDESVTNGPTDGPTDRRTDKASYRDARTHLKMKTIFPLHWKRRAYSRFNWRVSLKSTRWRPSVLNVC